MTRVLVLISGRGSNLQALIQDAAADTVIDAPYSICAVISDKPAAKGLELARQAGIPTQVVTKAEYPERLDYDRALMAIIDDIAPDLLVLAGFMRILSAPFVQHYQGRLLNIHPSLLPKFKGLDTHARALAAGESHQGATVHFVTEDLDSGPAILQLRVPVLANDDASSLGARVLRGEHLIYPLALRWLAAGRLTWRQGRIFLDGLPLARPVLMELP